jgi:hypothetical protein
MKVVGERQGSRGYFTRGIWVYTGDALKGLTSLLNFVVLSRKLFRG